MKLYAADWHVCLPLLLSGKAMKKYSIALSCRATLVGNRIIVMGGLGSRLWSCKEVSFLLANMHCMAC